MHSSTHNVFCIFAFRCCCLLCATVNVECLFTSEKKKQKNKKKRKRQWNKCILMGRDGTQTDIFVITLYFDIFAFFLFIDTYRHFVIHNFNNFFPFTIIVNTKLYIFLFMRYNDNAIDQLLIMIGMFFFSIPGFPLKRINANFMRIFFANCIINNQTDWVHVGAALILIIAFDEAAWKKHFMTNVIPVHSNRNQKFEIKKKWKYRDCHCKKT